MAKTKQQKKEILRNLEKKISKAKSIVFASFDKMAVKENEELRNELRAAESEYLVAKKTLLNLAFNKTSIKDFSVKDFSGQIVVIFSYQDEVAAAKIVDKFKNENEDKINFVGGILDLPAQAGKKFISAEEISALAKLPGKQELYASIVGSINAPVSGLVNALAGNMRNLLFALSAIKEAKD